MKLKDVLAQLQSEGSDDKEFMDDIADYLGPSGLNSAPESDLLKPNEDDAAAADSLIQHFLDSDDMSLSELNTMLKGLGVSDERLDALGRGIRGLGDDDSEDDTKEEKVEGLPFSIDENGDIEADDSDEFPEDAMHETSKLSEQMDSGEPGSEPEGETDKKKKSLAGKKVKNVGSDEKIKKDKKPTEKPKNALASRIAEAGKWQ